MLFCERIYFASQNKSDCPPCLVSAVVLYKRSVDFRSPLKVIVNTEYKQQTERPRFALGFVMQTDGRIYCLLLSINPDISIVPSTCPTSTKMSRCVG